MSYATSETNIIFNGYIDKWLKTRIGQHKIYIKLQNATHETQFNTSRLIEGRPW